VSTKVGLLGLGSMGQPMAAHIVDAGYDLVGFDPAGTAERIPPGGRAAGSGEEVLSEAEVVLLSLPDGASTMSVVDMAVSHGALGVRTIVDLSTIGPQAATRAAEELSGVGVVYTDGPVSGGVAGARAGTISLMYAGPEDVLDTHRALLESFSGKVFFVGTRAGQGQAMKLLNNFLSATALAATSEAIVFGRSHGLDMEVMLDVLNSSTGRNSATYDKFPNQVVTGRYATGFRTALMTKDVHLFCEVASAIESPSTVAEAVHEVWRGCDTELPGSDFSEIYRFVSEESG
jgi:3-hydroxyisobutyrate dehydrogenase